MIFTSNMKVATLLVIVVLTNSCESKTKVAEANIEITESEQRYQSVFQSIIDTSMLNGGVLIYDLKRDRFYSNDFDWANQGNLPASTFKIANSIIGLETGVIVDESEVFEWDGNEKWLKVWEQDLELRDAFQFSCVHCYQEVARKIGASRMNEHIEKLQYGSLRIDSTNIDQFWLRGESRITQFEQIDFLRRFKGHQLPIAKRTKRIVEDLMLMEANTQYRLSGKTGLSNEDEEYNGWFVGYLEVKDLTYFFSTNLEPDKEFDLDVFVDDRIGLTMDAFAALNIL